MTTLDNPWDFFTQTDEWYAFDRAAGYDTPGYLARVTMASSDMSNAELQDAIEAAVDDICRLNITGNYKKIVREMPDEDEEEENEESEEETANEDEKEAISV